MAVTYGTADLDRNTAVQDVTGTGPAGEATTKAQVVIAGGGGGAGAAGFETVGPPYVAAPANSSGTITLGGTAQNAIAAAVATKGWAVQNQSAGNLYVRQDAAATADQNALLIPPGMMYVADYVTGGAISIIGATTGQAFWARAW